MYAGLMKEIEVKAKVADFAVIKAQLEAKGCQFSAPISQDDTVYLPQPLTLADVGLGTVSLRIRRQGDKNILTLKKVLGNGLDKLEHEIVFDKPEQAMAMLKALDFHEVSHTIKTRQTAAYNGMEICLDEVRGLGSFIEVEKLTTEDADSAAVQAELFGWIKSLGVAAGDQVFKGYDILIFEKNKP